MRNVVYIRQMVPRCPSASRASALVNYTKTAMAQFKFWSAVFENVYSLTAKKNNSYNIFMIKVSSK